jgi:Fungal Zn(2)-Cys(6) binuclear cluster domain
MNTRVLPVQNPVAEPEGRIYQRAYKACVPCREKKVKCYLGPADQPAQPPCIKCRRSSLACYFDDKTRGGHRKRRKIETNGTNGTSSKVANFDAAPNTILHERDSTMLNENDPLALSELRNSGDAFNMLAAAAASKTSLVRNPSVAVISPISTLSDLMRKDAKTMWGKCIFVQNKYLTNSEAIDLVFFYYTALRDGSPFAHMEYADSNKHEKLIEQDTILLGAILTVASRLHAVPGIDGWSRSQLIHDRMWKWTKKEISSVVFGGRRPDKVGIGIVEACLLLSEWEPKDVLEGDDDHESDQSVTSDGDEQDDGNRDIKVVLEGAYRTDRFSWFAISRVELI